MKPINTLQYLLKSVTHNAVLLFVQAQMFFYRLGSQVEERWFVFTKKGSSLDYHVKQIVANMGNDEIVKKFAIACFILKQVGITQEKYEICSGLFKPHFILTFTIEREYLDWIDKMQKIKDVSDIMRFMVYIKITTTRQLAYMLGDEIFEKFRTSSIDDVYKYVSAEDVKRLQGIPK